MLKTLKTGALLSALAAAVAAGCSGGDSTGGSSKPATSSSSGSSSSSESETTESESTEGESSASADKPAEGGWGTITGRFVFDGDAPAPAKLNITKDVEFCSKNNPLDEELVVDPDTKGISNMIVMLYLARGQEAPAPHESYAEAAAAKVEVDNVDCRFEPHVQFVQAGTTVEFGNADTVAHNVKGDPFKNPGFNQSIASNASLEIPFAASENVPVPISCTIHPWMKGWLVVKDHPYVAISAADGSFELKNVPSGEWEFQVWQEKAGNLKQLKIDGKNKNLNRGRLKLSVFGETEGEPNEGNALGDISVPASNFE